MGDEAFPGSRSIPPFGEPSAERISRGCIDADETFDGTWPFKPHFFHGNGFAMHYVDENPAEKNVVVMLHGEPMWGYLYRNMIGPMSKSHRVIVPDHMGFGKSETPMHREYCVAEHTKNLIGLLDHLEVKNVTLFLQDWGVFIGSLYAMRRLAVVDRVFFGSLAIPAPAPSGKPQFPGPMRPLEDQRKVIYQQTGNRWFHWILSGLCEDPNTVYPAQIDERVKIGAPRCRTEHILLNMGSTAGQVIKHFIGFQSAENMTETWFRAYSSPFPTEVSAIGTLNFPLEAMGRLTMSAENSTFAASTITPEAWEAFRRKPVWFAVGAKDRAIVPSEAMTNLIRTHFPACPIVFLQDAGHFVQEDSPAELVALLQTFIQATGGKTIPFGELAGVPKRSLL